MKKIFLVLALISSLAQAGEWSSTDKLLAETALATAIIDWRQTQLIAEEPNCWEKNPLLGRKPSMKHINLYFAGAIIANYLIADSLSEKWRRAWLSGLIGLELITVNNNRQLGIKLKF